MDTTISVKGKNIQLEIKEHKIRLFNDDELATLLAQNTQDSTDALVTAIKAAFKKQNNNDIKISDHSMAVEIWGHVYSESFATAVKSLSPLGFIDSLADKIIGHCKVIDIGESGHDNNRFVWDRLAYFKSDIAFLLPDTTA